MKLRHINTTDEGILISDNVKYHRYSGAVVKVNLRHKLSLTHHVRRDIIWKGALIGGATFNQMINEMKRTNDDESDDDEGIQPGR